MTVLANFDLGDALVTVLSLFFIIIWIWILIAILSDLFRDHELSGWWKAVWVLFLIFIPFLTALIYLIARGQGMRDRAAKAQAEAQKHFHDYVRDTAAAASPGEELSRLADLKERGAISDEEYDKLKAKVVS
jgi:ABC-type transport system involved in cytochrome bd biosynthesis fused ATPase/permease subunit